MNGADVLVMIDGEFVGSQRDVTFEETTESIDFSSKDSRAQRVEPGRYSASVSLDALYVPSDTAYQSLKDAMRNGVKVQLIRVQESATLESCDAVVTSLSEAAPDQDAVTVSASFDVDGEWTSGS